MKRFALFVALTVGAFAAYTVARGYSSPASDPQSDGEGIPLPEPETAPEAPGTVSDFFAPVVEFFAPVIEPIKDTTVTITRAAFGTPYDDLITASANTYGIPPEVLYKLLRQESRFRPDIIDGRTKSPTGALGIAQFMPATAVEELGSVAAALDPAQAIPGAARYLSKLRGMLGGDLTKAVAAYNWGIGNVKRKGLANAPTETVNYAFNILGVKLS